jgi:hypothetical protein
MSCLIHVAKALLLWIASRPYAGAPGGAQIVATDLDSSRLYQPRIFNRTTKSRFLRDRTSALIGHLGREPSFPERIIIARAVAIEWELRRLDARLDRGEELSGHALRARLAGENRLRLDLLALGLKPATARPPTLAEVLRQGRTGAAV